MQLEWLVERLGPAAAALAGRSEGDGWSLQHQRQGLPQRRDRSALFALCAAIPTRSWNSYTETPAGYTAQDCMAFGRGTVTSAAPNRNPVHALEITSVAASANRTGRRWGMA